MTSVYDPLDETGPRKVIYLDNAATSWPKPRVVVAAMTNFIMQIGANPGRSGHMLAASAARVVFDTREAVAELLGVPDSRYLIFTANATQAINLALKGLLKPGDHVVTSSLEHNAVMRPLNQLKQQLNLEISRVAPDDQGLLQADAFVAALKPDTKLVVVTHASNVTGIITPIAKIKAAIGGIPLLVDAAQTAGAVPINFARDNIDLLAFTGHKALLGPQGTGGLCLRPGQEALLTPLTPGGTGSRSESEQPTEDLPDKFEGGTLNTPGIAGLGAAIRWIEQRGMETLRQHELELTSQLLDGLRKLSRIEVYGPLTPELRTATIAFNITGISPSEVGRLLDREHNVMVRTGLHCCPAVHRTLGTLNAGTVRIGAGPLSTHEEIAHALRAIGQIACNGAAS